jgi:hypothetical protein
LIYLVLYILYMHNEELHTFCSSPNVIRMVKSRRVRWAMHIVCIVSSPSIIRTIK